jgi:hypothetical protein
MSEPERVVGYARQSVTNNRDSLCAQADLITQWCSEHGHEPRSEGAAHRPRQSSRFNDDERIFDARETVSRTVSRDAEISEN